MQSLVVDLQTSAKSLDEKATAQLETATAGAERCRAVTPTALAIPRGNRWILLMPGRGRLLMWSGGMVTERPISRGIARCCSRRWQGRCLIKGSLNSSWPPSANFTKLLLFWSCLVAKHVTSEAASHSSLVDSQLRELPQLRIIPSFAWRQGGNSIQSRFDNPEIVAVLFQCSSKWRCAKI